MIEFATEGCRSCGAQVIWCETERTLKSTPIDAEPSKGGNVAIVARDGKQPLARVVGRDLAFGRTDLRLSHFATCPHAKSWRSRRGGS